MQKVSILSRRYWREAANSFGSSKMLSYAAVICALRVAVKALKIPIPGTGVSLTFDCYINSLGSFIYGPLVGLAVGAISDTVGFMLFPSGPYFFPFIFVEMSSSFLFGLFFWQRKVAPTRAMLAKFTVNLFCNLIITTLIMKWMYVLTGAQKAYPFFNAVRVAKNLVLFPLESILICILLNAFIPLLNRFGVTSYVKEKKLFHAKDIVLLVTLFLLSVGLVLFYVFFLNGWLAAHNLKFW